MPVTAEQVKQEYQEGMDFLVARKERWVKQLVLMNNLQRPDESIASTMLFSFFTRVFSNLYDDHLQVKFVPTTDADYRATRGLSLLQQNDYQEMDKASIDYDWTWDTLFFGQGYCETLNFDKERKLLIPHVINPLVMIYDPFFPNHQDWRYYGKWVLLSKNQLQAAKTAGELESHVNIDGLPTGVEAMIWSYDTRRKAAKQGVANSSETSSPLGIYQIYEHFTHDPDTGEKWIVWTDKDITQIVRKKKLELKDGPKGSSLWPLSVKKCFREPHSTLPTSVPDIIEDKHRALNVLYNLSYIAAKDETNPIYVYAESGVKDVSQLFQRQIEQHIATKGDRDPDTVIRPLRKSPAVTASVSQFISLLKSESAESIGTSQVSQPLQKGKKTATEAALSQQIADLTSSLQGKVMAQGEREFWSQWYQRYMIHMEDGDVKIINVMNIDGVNFESMKLEDIRTKYPPRIEVKSAKEAEMKTMVARKDMMTLFPTLAKTLGPKENRLFMKNILLPKFDMPVDTIESLYPKSIEEIKAEQENGMIERNKLPMIEESDDDIEHLYIHLRGRNTAAKWAHIFAHEEQLARKKAAEAAAAQGGGGLALPGGPGAPPAELEEPGGQAPVPGVSESTIEGAAAPAVAALKKVLPNKLRKPIRA